MAIFTILQLTIFDILLPTGDVIGDINFAIAAFVSKNYGITCLMIFPVLLNMAFTSHKWLSTDFDAQKEKRFSWILVVLNLWPQYQVCKLLFTIFRGKCKDNWEPVKDKIKKELYFIEPFIEAIPQFFVSVAVFNLLFNRSHSPKFGASLEIWNENNTVITDVFGTDSFGIDNDIMFPLNMLISTLSGVKCIVDYLSNGPIKLTSNTKCGKVVLLSAMLMYVISSYVWKLVILIFFFPWMWDIQKNVLGGEEAHGILGFFIAVLIFIAFPMLISIGPLARVVGFRKSTKMYLNHPELFVLPLITEYVPGPMNGNIPCCRCCNCWSCCTWTCCCKGCKPVKTNKIVISKSMSWNRMLYTQLLMLPFYMLYMFEENAVSACLILYLPCLGLVSFGITLHCGNTNVMVLPGNKGGTRNVEGEVVELESQKMLPQNNSEDV